MRILQIINSLAMGGAEKLVTESAVLFRRKNVIMDVVTLKYTNSALENEIESVSLSKGSVYNPFLIFKIIPLLKKYDLIHIHLFPTLYWVVIAKFISFSNVKLIYTEHSTNNKRRGNKLLQLFDRLIYRGLDKIVTISSEVDIKLKTHLAFKSYEQTILIHNGINFEKYNNASPYLKSNYFDDDSIVLIQVSSFRYPKDQKTVIDALQILPRKYKLLLVGTGPDIDILKKYCEKLNLADRIKFLGIRTDVQCLLKMSDFIILSSAYEGMSLSSIEGMSVGKPFIASKVSGLTSIVEGYGILFEFGNYEELANIIEKLHLNENLYIEVSTKCLKRAKMFSLTNTVDQYIGVYQNLIR